MVELLMNVQIFTLFISALLWTCITPWYNLEQAFQPEAAYG